MSRLASFCQQRGFALIPICLILLACGLWPEMELLVPSFPSMKRAFGVSDAQIQQLLTVNFFGFIVGVLFAGPLCDTVGRRPILIYGSVAYLTASALAIFASTFPIMMTARFLQGLTVTGPLIAGGVMLVEATSGVRQLFWMSLANSIITFCMAAAPIVGTWVNQAFSFQGNLWAIFILGVVGLIPALAFVPESLSQEKRKPLHPSILIKGYITLLCDWRFMVLAIPICVLAAAYWIYVGVSALYMVDYLLIPASSFASYQGPIVGCFALVSLAASKLVERFGVKRSLRVGNTVMFSGLIGLLIMSASGSDHALATTLLMMLIAGGMAPVCAMLYPYSMQHLPPELQGNAQSLIHALRLLFASLGTFTLGFAYKGPLLPVALVMAIFICVGGIFLWQGRSFVTDSLDGTSQPVVGH